MKSEQPDLDQRIIDKALMAIDGTTRCKYPDWMTRRMELHRRDMKLAVAGEIVNGRTIKVVAMKAILHGYYELRMAEWETKHGKN